MHDQKPGPKGKEIRPNVEVVMDMLVPLLGVWKGQGRGGFPTLDEFNYSETLRFLRDHNAPYLTYEQKTELIDPDGRPIRKSHWEAGILRALADGSIELACVQGSGRVEILRGKFLTKESPSEKLSLLFQSELIGNDERVRSSSRKWILTGTHFMYVMNMATSSVEEPTLHVEANLYKL